MANSLTMTGARALFGTFNPHTGRTTPLGIFNNVSFGLTYDVQPIYILGKFAPAETVYTSQEPVSITCSGWRVIDHGPHVDGQMPKLADLLNSQYLSLSVMDRQRMAGGKDGRIAKFEQVRMTGYSTTVSARQTQEVTCTFMAILVSDESVTNNEHPSAATLPAN